ncbi:MAG: NAD-dependent epimerase/dehydratase family protein [Candidatus Eisenbacteria bacterium]|uniref:NAD-dependent epimerase/dehydratase family protein n=1 Tax=Eiseniibacteriota bacterium TaxID=2212470 RepID=A0A538U3Q6_UNCEI|nr:MAG: NAD-dependent epimerase/dehydratase family protein [Candidatus Eisenbacteria bacterium]
MSRFDLPAGVHFRPSGVALGHRGQSLPFSRRRTIVARTDCVLVTGSAGMMGAQLLEYFAARLPREALIGSYFEPTIPIEDIMPFCTPVVLDVTNGPAVLALIGRHRPTHIFHLAAQSLLTTSWEKPNETISINMSGTVNVFESVRSVKRQDAGYDPVVVVACSSAEYGASLTPQNLPVREDAPLLPLHPYGISKVGQDLLAFQYFRNFQLRCIRARIFATTGPRTGSRKGTASWRSRDTSRNHRRPRRRERAGAALRPRSLWRGLQHQRRSDLSDPRPHSADRKGRRSTSPHRGRSSPFQTQRRAHRLW